jgi:hypothetical protein
VTDPSPPSPRLPPEQRWLAPPFHALLNTWLGIAASSSIALFYTLNIRRPENTEYFFLRQDLPALFIWIFTIIGLGLFGRTRVSPVDRRVQLEQRTQVFLLSAICLVAGALGQAVIFDGYTLSLDEFLANFDAKIFAHGQWMAPVAPEWRPFTPALQPMYLLPTHGDFWASSYLPVNAAMRAAASAVGCEGLVNPLLSAFSVVAVWGVGRQLWPDRPALALGAAALLATSPQLIVMSMTAYAMPAHLAFNLAWLWLYLRGGRLGHAGAIATGFVASGIHQLIFHPLFAAPFILQLWLERRWWAALAYTLAYGLITGFWIEYWQVEFKLLGVAAASAPSVGGDWFVKRISDILDSVRLRAIGQMGQSLFRFVTWQNPLTAPLAVLGLGVAVKAKGYLRAMVAGVFITLMAVAILVPSQVHGWGYRYLHGLLGSICLIAAWTWDRLTRSLPAPQKAAAARAFAVACVTSLVVLTPFRAWQAWRYVRPYALASRQIQSATAQVVIVDHWDTPGFDAGTVVRNDPYLSHGPKVMELAFMNRRILRQACERYTVQVFDGRDAAADGIDVDRFKRPPGVARLRALMRTLNCGQPLLAATPRPAA